MFIFYGRFLYTQRLKDAHHKSKKNDEGWKNHPHFIVVIVNCQIYWCILRYCLSDLYPQEYWRCVQNSMCSLISLMLLSISSSSSSLFNFDTFRIIFCWRVSVCARLHVMNVLAKRIKKTKTATKKVCNNKILKKLQKLFLRQMFFAPVEIFSVLCVKWPCQQTKSVCVCEREMKKLKLKEWVQKKRKKNVITKRLLKLLKYLVTIQNENRMSRLQNTFGIFCCVLCTVFKFCFSFESPFVHLLCYKFIKFKLLSHNFVGSTLSKSSQTTTRTDHIYSGTTWHIGVLIQQNAIPRHFYAWRSCTEDQFARI